MILRFFTALMYILIKIINHYYNHIGYFNWIFIIEIIYNRSLAYLLANSFMNISSSITCPFFASYDRLSKKPLLFKSFTGLTVQ